MLQSQAAIMEDVKQMHMAEKAKNRPGSSTDGTQTSQRGKVHSAAEPVPQAEAGPNSDLTSLKAAEEEYLKKLLDPGRNTDEDLREDRFNDIDIVIDPAIDQLMKTGRMDLRSALGQEFYKWLKHPTTSEDHRAKYDASGYPGKREVMQAWGAMKIEMMKKRKQSLA
eukprot:373699-Karenia_brevis.AAC.1